MYVYFHFRKPPEGGAAVELPAVPHIGDHVSVGGRSGTVLSVGWVLDTPPSQVHIEIEEKD